MKDRRKINRARFAKFKPEGMSWREFEKFVKAWIDDPPSHGQCCGCGEWVPFEQCEHHQCITH